VVGGNNHDDSWNDNNVDDNDGMYASFSVPPPLPPPMAAAAVVEVKAYIVVAEDNEDEETRQSRITELEHHIHDLSQDLAMLRVQTMLDQQNVQAIIGVEIENSNQSSSSSRDPNNLESQPPKQRKSDLHLPDHAKDAGSATIVVVVIFPIL